MKKYSKNQSKDFSQAYIYYLGRYIYNLNYYKYNWNLDYINIFREVKFKKITDVKKSVLVNCNNISQAIEWNKIIGYSILSELDIVGDKICNFGYVSIFNINNCYTNPETHYFTINNLHVSKIETLPSYEKIDFSCWNGITNKRIKELLKGSDISNDEEGIALSQTLSLFLCEASRNPVSFITAPMCFELSEYWSDRIKQDILLFYNEKRIIKKDYPIYLNYYQNIFDLELSKLTEEDRVILDYNIVDQTVRSSIIINFFPMVIEKAVAASRHISTQLNIILEKYKKSNLKHLYDYTLGSESDALKLICKEKELLSEWKKYISDDIIKSTFNIMNSWYDIKINDIDLPDETLIGEIFDFIN